MTPILARELAAPAVVRFGDLEQRYTTSRATEPGFRRWIVSYLGGPPDYVNPSPETGILSDGVVVGLMGIPPGNRQHGFHVHDVAEIYVVLRGRLRSLGPGGDHLAGPLDCLVIQGGAPHGVEAVGDEEALFVWLHDALEPAGRAPYYDELEDAPPGGEPIRLVPWASLAAEGTAGRTGRTWLRDGVELHSLELEPNATEEGVADTAEVAVVASGEVEVRSAHEGVRLGPLDALVVPPGSRRTLAAAGGEGAQLIVVRE